MTSQIYIRPCLVEDKGTWRVRARIKDPLTGKHRYLSKSTGYKVKDSTKRKAEIAMKEIASEWEQELNEKKISLESPRFSETIMKWRNYKKETLRKSTLAAYDYNINKHILPCLGKLRTKEITMYQLQDFYKELLKKHLSVKTVRKIRVIINGAMEDAIANRIRSDNPTAHIKLPKAEKYSGRALSINEMRTLLQALDDTREPIKTAMLLGVTMGLRREEVCGLRWQDIDFPNNSLHVQNTVVKNGKETWEQEKTKTPKSNRVLFMPELLINHLKELKETQEKAGLKLDKVCRWENGKNADPSYISHASAKIFEKCGISDIRFHDLRHTAGTLVAKSATVKQVQTFLGHEDISTTLNIYVHDDEEDRKQVAGIMDNIIKNSLGCAENCAEPSNVIHIEKYLPTAATAN